MEKSSTEKFLDDLMAQPDGTAVTEQPAPQPGETPGAPPDSMAILPFVVGGVLLLITFLPSVVAVTNSRRFLGLLAILFNLLAVACIAIGVPFLARSGGLFGFTIIVPALATAATTLWFAALICGAACSLAGMAEQRERQAHKINMRAPMAPRLR